MLDALRLSVGTLTIVPSGTITEIDRHTAARAMIIAPLASLGYGRGAAGLAGPNGRAALLAVGLLVVGGLASAAALHLDGLADTTDSARMDCGTLIDGDAARRRRTDGVVALIMVLGLQAVSIGELIQSAPGALLVGAAVCRSRRSASLRTRRTGCPRDGLGVAVAGSPPTAAAARLRSS